MPSAMQPPLPVSLIMTVRNEADSLPALLASLEEQTAVPAEIVIADGGSTDGTQQIIHDYQGTIPIRLLDLPGANISQGRNAAIRAARHEIIAATDAGVRLDPHWLERITTPLLVEGSHVDVVSGFFLPDHHSPFEAAMGATVLPAVEDIEPQSFLPSSRSIAFRKGAWEAVGGYPEWLDYCEDLVFDMRLKDTGHRLEFVPDAVVYFRPRSSLKAFYLQYYRYARGDGKADLWRKRHALRYATYVIGPILALQVIRTRRTPAGKLALMLVTVAGAAYCRRPWMRLRSHLKTLPPVAALKVLALVPVIRVVGDVAKMAGYPVGVLWRLKHRARRQAE